ncbi:MAG TPA: glutaminase [Clostridiales bacterium]|nr:glutaminase [Clostridiales bacterium]HQP70913.1 glutaminase [Clostridiales bacterium]
MDYGKVIKEIYAEISDVKKEGKVADYIPELSVVDPDKFGITLITSEGRIHSAGDSDERFSIQSISKVFTLSMAFSLLGDKIWDRTGVEPSGSPFNSIVQLEYEKGKPRNPFINAGALVVCDILFSKRADPKNEILGFVRKLAGCGSINYNMKVAESERSAGYRNAALINMMRSYGNIKNPVEKVLDLYYTVCSIELTCTELAKAFLHYTNIRKDFDICGYTLTRSQIRRINALMLCCGLYDESGEFAFEVGLPGKSGVGGGIAAVNPDHYSVAVWSPLINEKGNSVAGMKFLERLTTITDDSIF